ncbi:unnamed protein product [Cuscuta europaea]|uniref:RT-TIP n=1 Tax=Cuscuta europaea TaxID=41803 RepID=A0A9P0Z1N4_CUSEU|nr:unnamed protein product [Cuscuta europaea]
MPRNYSLGRAADEASHPDSVRATLSEFLSTFLFVFVGEGAVLSIAKLYPGADEGRLLGGGASGLTVLALAQALALFAAVAASINVSGGHVNPAVTLGALVCGRVSFLRALYYLVAQLLGAVVASLVLRIATDGLRPAGFALAHGEGWGSALLLEIIMTFGLMYTVYATALDPNQKLLHPAGASAAPLAIAFVVGANVFVGGPFTGACMNPARAFGPALVGWRWSHHWIYWLGPFIGAALAALIYEFGIVQRHTHPDPHHQPLAPAAAAEDY